MAGERQRSGRAARDNAALTGKSPDAFRTISEVSEELDLPQHVLRFWETKFSQIRPLKRAGGRRLYRPDHIALLRGIKALLYDDGLTIKGAQKVLRERGQKAVVARGRADAELSLEIPQVPSDAAERLAALRARLEARGEAPAPDLPADAPLPKADVRASIDRLEAVLERLERRRANT
ncbi:MAG: MerR family transcriptional regulator [Pseudomonadota bacterium]